MEIHPPTKPIESVKDFFLHLFMITLGVLIALGLEQTVEAWRHHELGVQARENILNEVRDNKRRIDGARRAVAKNAERRQSSLNVVREYLAHQKLAHAEMSILINGATLSSTSWTTASATGALGYLGYADAKRFATAYYIQALLEHAQDDEYQTAIRAFALLKYSPGGPATLSDEQLRSVERDVLDYLGQLTFWQQLAAPLSAEYESVLKAK
ncbi:MAG: hypothetical protein LAP40_04225 [Acidobacteriia bacterium]|nr:hypothetical protein [Terriglobia bacterium]